MTRFLQGANATAKRAKGRSLLVFLALCLLVWAPSWAGWPQNLSSAGRVGDAQRVTMPLEPWESWSLGSWRGEGARRGVLAREVVDRPSGPALLFFRFELWEVTGPGTGIWTVDEHTVLPKDLPAGRLIYLLSETSLVDPKSEQILWLSYDSEMTFMLSGLSPLSVALCSSGVGQVETFAVLSRASKSGQVNLTVVKVEGKPIGVYPSCLTHEHMDLWPPASPVFSDFRLEFDGQGIEKIACGILGSSLSVIAFPMGGGEPLLLGLDVASKGWTVLSVGDAKIGAVGRKSGAS